MATKTTTNTSDSGFSEDELAAMKQRAAELRAEKKGGAMWVTSYAVVEIGQAEEKLIRSLVKKAAG